MAYWKWRRTQKYVCCRSAYVLQFWDSKCRHDGTHYELPIPWIDPNEPLPNNLCVAHYRLEHLLSRLHREGLFSRYDCELQTLVKEDYAEIVPRNELHDAERIWYIPHHCVFNVNKPDKLRVVFECATKYRDKSLNDRCFKGPDLMNNLSHVLLNFRVHQYAIQSDIKAMYNQVCVPVSDRNALRFLWLKDGKLVHYRISSHFFGGIWCASASIYTLRCTIQDDTDVLPIVRDTIMKGMYVDDCLKSVESFVDARSSLTCLPQILKSGGFDFTKFSVNDRRLLENIQIDDWSKEVHEFTSESVGKALGVRWNVFNDTFGFTVKITV